MPFYQVQARKTLNWSCYCFLQFDELCLASVSYFKWIYMIYCFDCWAFAIRFLIYFFCKSAKSYLVFYLGGDSLAKVAKLMTIILSIILVGLFLFILIAKCHHQVFDSFYDLFAEIFSFFWLQATLDLVNCHPPPISWQWLCQNLCTRSWAQLQLLFCLKDHGLKLLLIKGICKDILFLQIFALLAFCIFLAWWL